MAYRDIAFLWPIDLDQYIETNYADVLYCAKEAAGTLLSRKPMGVNLAKILSGQTQVDILGAQPAAMSPVCGEDVSEMEWTSAQNNVPQWMRSHDHSTTPPPSLLPPLPLMTVASLSYHSNVEDTSEYHLQYDIAPYSPYNLIVSGDFESSQGLVLWQHMILHSFFFLQLIHQQNSQHYRFRSWKGCP
ncbi:hypothetical protein BDR05DRAFT_947353 [Suillus weaverae]|nr:hypothetical protein BDR05DRAFT_947353 [Suillus weaverae]